MHWTDWAIWWLYWRLDLVLAVLLLAWSIMERMGHLSEIKEFDDRFVKHWNFDSGDFARFFAPNPDVRDTVGLVLAHGRFYGDGIRKLESPSGVKYASLVAVGSVLASLAGLFLFLLLQSIFVIAMSKAIGEAPPKSVIGAFLDNSSESQDNGCIVFALIGLSFAATIALFIHFCRLPANDIYQYYLETFQGDRTWVRRHRRKEPWREMIMLVNVYNRHVEKSSREEPANPAAQPDGYAAG